VIGNYCALASPCGRNCNACLAPSDDSKCISCSGAFALYSGSVSYCVSNVCDASLHCKYCITNTTNDCVQCNTNYGFYITASKVCATNNCYRNCKYCIDNSAHKCLLCTNTYLVFRTSSPSLCGYIGANCHSNCAFCLSLHENDCIDCNAGYSLYNAIEPSYCVTTIGCDPKCSKCLNSTFCIECQPDFTITVKNTCIKECPKGFRFTEDAPYCVEICGDGLNLGAYECDDGNTINGDGCDSTCNKETNAICTTLANKTS